MAIALALSVLNVSAAGAKLNGLQVSARKGLVSQEKELATAYLTGNGVSPDARMAAYWYQRAAESGDPAAQNELGLLYQEGVGVPADPKRAIHWFQLSAASGFIEAKVNLGVAYFGGLGVPKDEGMAARLSREAIDRGNGAAATYLGDMYFFGHGMSVDKSVAEKWLKTGVKLHDPIAEFSLGLLFTGKEGHPYDIPKATKLLRRSAGAGYVPAMYSPGALLLNRIDLVKSPEEPLRLLDTAANAGSWRSSVLLGVLARDGRGVSRDPEAAYYHFQVAVLQGGEPARRLLTNELDVFGSKLTVEQRSTSVANANSWFHDHGFPPAFVHKDGKTWKGFTFSPSAALDDSVPAGELVEFPLARDAGRKQEAN